MARRQVPIEFNRREFIEMAAAAGVACAVTEELVEAKPDEPGLKPQRGVKLLQAACPYCGVGCGTLIQVQNGKVVGMVPDRKHPTNRGIQCIKGLNAHEPIYRDRLEKVLVRKDMSDPLKGHVSKTKGKFTDDVFEEMSYEDAEELVADKITAIIKARGSNTIGLNGSGQLTMEAQWIENVLMKGIIQSNSIEANARMCMTSAVTGYFHSYGSDAPPTSYDDIEEADFISFWGHNAREAHPILFWRVADHKQRKDIPTLVSDPRTTGTVMGFESINPRNSYHLQTLNGDISYHNAIAHVLLTKYPEAMHARGLARSSTRTGWRRTSRASRHATRPSRSSSVLRAIDRGRVTVELIEQIAKAWAEASDQGPQARAGRSADLLGDRLQPDAPRPAQHDRPDQPASLNGQCGPTRLRQPFADRPTQRHERTVDGRADRAVAIQQSHSRTNSGATTSPTHGGFHTSDSNRPVCCRTRAWSWV